jgi:hypothetical protein
VRNLPGKADWFCLRVCVCNGKREKNFHFGATMPVCGGKLAGNVTNALANGIAGFLNSSGAGGPLRRVGYWRRWRR